LALIENDLHQLRYLFALKPFNADADDGWKSCAGQCNQSMKICVESNDKTPVGVCVFDDCWVFGFGKTDFSSVYRIKTCAT